MLYSSVRRERGARPKAQPDVCGIGGQTQPALIFVAVGGLCLAIEACLGMTDDDSALATAWTQLISGIFVRLVGLTTLVCFGSLQLQVGP